MIVEERLTTYLHSLESADIPVLDEIEQEALADMVPIIRKETKSFLKVMLEIKRPVKILCNEKSFMGFSIVCPVAVFTEAEPFMETEVFSLEFSVSFTRSFKESF